MFFMSQKWFLTHIQVTLYLLWEGSYKVLTFLLQKLTSGLLRALWAILRHKTMSHIRFTIWNPDVSSLFFWTFCTFLLLNWPRSYLLHHCSYLSVSSCWIFHISKIYQRKRAMFSTLVIARTHFKDLFVALLYCAFTTFQLTLNNGNLNSSPLWKMAGYHLGNCG